MIDQYPPSNGVLTSLIWRKTAAGGETSLSGYDNANQPLSYTPGQEQVYLNGILLVRGDDYTATNGTSITGLSALSASDFVQINCYNNFSVASVPTTSLTGEVTNSQITSLATSKLTGTIANNQLANSSITINGSAVSLGGSTTIAGGSAQDDAPTSPTEGQLWLDTNGTLSSAGFTEKATLTTTGDIYYASSASTPARLGIGSSGQVLSVSGGVPAWETPSTGALVYITGATLTNASSWNFPDNTFTSTYRNYLIVMEGRDSSNNDAIYWFFRAGGTNNGSGNVKFAVDGVTFDNGTFTQTGTANSYFLAGYPNASGGAYTLTVYAPQVATYTQVTGIASATSNATSQGGHTSFSAFVNATTQYDAMGFTMSANSYTGTYRVYGIKDN